MGLTESQLNDSSIQYLVRRLNGMRAHEERQVNFTMSLIREVCYYAANGGNFRHGVKKDQIYKLPSDIEAEKNRVIELGKALKDVGFMDNWQKANWKAPVAHD